MTVNFPSGRSTSIPLRLFWRAPRISMQSFCVGLITRVLFPIIEPTGDSPELRDGSQIFVAASLCEAFLRGRAIVAHRATATNQTPRRVARADFVTLPAPRRLTNQKILCARRTLF